MSQIEFRSSTTPALRQIFSVSSSTRRTLCFAKSLHNMLRRSVRGLHCSWNPSPAIQHYQFIFFRPVELLSHHCGRIRCAESRRTGRAATKALLRVSPYLHGERGRLFWGVRLHLRPVMTEISPYPLRCWLHFRCPFLAHSILFSFVFLA